MQDKNTLTPSGFTQTGATEIQSKHPIFLDKDKQVDAILIGDSITAALDEKMISKRLTIINKGVPADRTKIMKQRYEKDVLQFRPKRILLLGGVNDIGYWLGGTVYTGFSEQQIIDEVIGNLTTMIQDGQASGSEMFIGTIMPVDRKADGLSDNVYENMVIRKVNEKIRVLAKEMQLTLIEYHEAFVHNNVMNAKFSEDGVHPNQKGNDLMIELIRYALGISE